MLVFVVRWLAPLASQVTRLVGPGGTSVVLIGTVHTLAASAQTVNSVLQSTTPSAVVVELCSLRIRESEGVKRCGD